MKLGANLPTYRAFALEELKEATNNFSHTSIMGDGSHGEVCTHLDFVVLSKLLPYDKIFH